MSQLSSILDLRTHAGAVAVPGEATEPAGSLWDAVFDISSLDGENGFVIHGETSHADSFAGHSVASAGDVNGDGFDDVIIGAPDTYPGSSYVIYGRAGGYPATLELDTLSAADGFRIDGEGGGAGWSVASAGDVNGDGFGDLIIGAPYLSRDGDNSGASYVVFGKAGGLKGPLDLADLNGKAGFSLLGDFVHGYSGFSVASAGDLNGDGFDDMVVGGRNAGAGGDGAGQTYVVFGHGGKFAATLDLADLHGANGFRIDGPEQRSSGYSVASAGDVNGDGVADLIIGSPGSSGSDHSPGGGYVVFGSEEGFAATLDLTTLDGTNGFHFNGLGADDYAGQSVASAGDVNGDGFDDIIVGMGFGHLGDYAVGGSFVVFGKASGFSAEIDLADLNGRNGFAMGSTDMPYTGFSVASAGDVNGDGFDDLIIGNWRSNATFVVFGKAGKFDPMMNLSDLDGHDGFRIDSSDAIVDDDSGFSVASAGDVNGDGLADLIVGAPSAWPNGAGAGYVIFGKAPTTAVSLVGTNASQSLVGGELKDSLSGMAGDDMLWGHGGKDKLTGGTGDDTLIGGAGKDVLVGSTGADVFQYRDLGDSTLKSSDLIKGIGATDVIDLHLIDANTNKTGDQGFHLVSSFSGAAGELTVSFDGKQTLVQGDVNGDGTADLVIAVSGDHHDFTNFVL